MQGSTCYGCRGAAFTPLHVPTARALREGPKLGRNEQAVVSGREAPVKSILIRPRDRTQWTYYLAERRLLGYFKYRETNLGNAETLFNRGKLEESARAFEGILLREPENPAALTGLGFIELKKGNIEKAERYFDQSLNIQKTSLALLGKAYLAISRNQTVEAAEILAMLAPATA